MRFWRLALVTDVVLAAVITTAGAQPINGVYTVDDATNTGLQVFGDLTVGSAAAGTMNILEGRLVRANGQTVIGRTIFATAGNGTINVGGNHSRLDSGNYLSLALSSGSSQGSFGYLNITAGGQVRAPEVHLAFTGFRAEAHVTVSGSGSLLETVTLLVLRQATSPVLNSTVTIGTGGTVSVGTGITVSGSPDIILDGGTLSLTGPSALPPSGIIQFNSGSLRFRSSQTLAAGTAFLTEFYGSPPVFGAGRGLTIDGTTTLSTSLLLDGGALRTSAIAVNPSTGSILLNGGTLTLTGEGVVIDDGGDFGPDPLIVGDGLGAPMLLELDGAGDVLLGAVTVAADGVLNFGGESLIVDSLNNGGSVSLADATLDVRAGLQNGGSLGLADVVVEGDVSSPAGATIDVAGTVVFNGNYAGAAAFYGSGTVVFNGTLSVD